MDFQFDISTGEYLDADGNIIPESDIRDWIDEMLAALALLFIGRAEKLKADFTQDNFLEWNRLMRIDITNLHNLMNLIAFGGSNTIQSGQWTAAETAINTQLKYWDNLATGVFLGIIALNQSFINRTGLYAAAGYTTFQDATINREVWIGRDEYKNNLGIADHCVECVAETRKGWVPIGNLIRIGMRQCKVRCRCWFSFRQTPPPEP